MSPMKTFGNLHVTSLVVLIELQSAKFHTHYIKNETFQDEDVVLHKWPSDKNIGVRRGLMPRLVKQ